MARTGRPPPARSIVNAWASPASARPEHLHLFERHVLHLVLGVGAFQLDEVGAGRAIDLHVLEVHVAHVAGHFVAHVLVDDRLEADQLALAFAVQPHILDDHVLQPHFLARLEQEGVMEKWMMSRLRRVMSRMNGARLSWPSRKMRARSHQRTQFSTVMRSTLLLGALKSRPFSATQSSSRADEAIGDEHVLRVAGVDAVVVLHAGAAELHVAHGHMAAVARHDGPMATRRGW